MAESNQTFRPGIDRVLYTQAVFDEREIRAVEKALRDGWLGAGKYTAEFENRVSALFGKKYGIFVNSGTSANELAMEIAGLKPGDEVITQACTFPATLSPIVRQGYVPVLVDSKIETLNIDLDAVEQAITDRTRAIFISHAIGNVNDMRRLREICDRHRLVFIEDACDTIGCRFAGRPTGEYSDITTTSFYAAHNITAGGGGGMVMVNDPKLIEEARMLNDWGRALPGTADQDLAARFSTQDDADIDGKFWFVRRTYNFKAVEMQAAFGLVQLEKLAEFNNRRIANVRRLMEFFKKYPFHFQLPDFHPEAEVYLLAFPITIAPASPIARKELMQYLEEHQIQTRTVFAGNILRHPAYRDIKRRVHGTLENSDYIMRNSLMIGCHHGLTDAMLDYVIATFEKYLREVNLRAVEKLRREINESIDQLARLMQSQ